MGLVSREQLWQLQQLYMLLLPKLCLYLVRLRPRQCCLMEKS